MTYQEYKAKRQKEFDELPIFFAFSNAQFKEQMEKRGLTENDLDKIYKLGRGGFYLRTDAEKVKAFFNREDELPKLMNNHKFAVSAFYYEMNNHEYAINYYQGDWDVLNCFSDKELEFDDNKDYKDYLKEMGKTIWIPAYEEARRKHYKAAESWM